MAPAIHRQFPPMPERLRHGVEHSPATAASCMAEGAGELVFHARMEGHTGAG